MKKISKETTSRKKIKKNSEKTNKYFGKKRNDNLQLDKKSKTKILIKEQKRSGETKKILQDVEQVKRRLEKQKN